MTRSRLRYLKVALPVAVLGGALGYFALRRSAQDGRATNALLIALRCRKLSRNSGGTCVSCTRCTQALPSAAA